MEKIADLIFLLIGAWVLIGVVFAPIIGFYAAMKYAIQVLKDECPKRKDKNQMLSDLGKAYMDGDKEEEDKLYAELDDIGAWG